MVINSSYIGKTCPYCQFPIKKDSEAVKCSACKVPHHQECWEENGGCTTFGCQGIIDGAHHVRGLRGSQGSNRIEIEIDDLPDGYEQGYMPDLDKSILYSYPKAGSGKRIGAFIIDFVISLIPSHLASLLFIYFETPPPESVSIIYLFIILVYGWIIIFLLLRDGFGRGQSPGKKMLGLMVVFLSNNQPCTIGLSVKRNFLYFFLSLIELIVPLFHNKGYRLGDMIAKTQVIEVNHYRRFNGY